MNLLQRAHRRLLVARLPELLRVGLLVAEAAGLFDEVYLASHGEGSSVRRYSGSSKDRRRARRKTLHECNDVS